MSKWVCYYHVVWSTKQRLPTLIGERIGVAERMVRAIGRDHECEVIAFGTMPDHVHVAISIPPKASVSDIVRRLKGGSCKAIGELEAAIPEWGGWQHEYSVFTFGQPHLSRVIRYIETQAEHHANGNTIPAYEPD